MKTISNQKFAPNHFIVFLFFFAFFVVPFACESSKVLANTETNFSVAEESSPAENPEKSESEEGMRSVSRIWR